MDHVKKLVVLMLFAITPMVVGFSGCGGKKAEDAPATPAPAAANTAAPATPGVPNASPVRSQMQQKFREHRREKHE